MDVSVAFAVFFTLIDARHLVPIFAILVIVVMATVVRVTFLVKVVEYRRSILLNFDNVLVADGKKLDYFGQHASSICID